MDREARLDQKIFTYYEVRSKVIETLIKTVKQNFIINLFKLKISNFN
jgi:hypothetical protein